MVARCWNTLTVAVTGFMTLTVAGTALAGVSCYGPRQQLAAAVVGDHQANPRLLLQQFPTGGAQLSSRIRDLAATDSATLPTILALLSSSNKEQKAAIGSGLAQAAKICIKTQQEYAGEIQAAVAKTKDEDVVLAYTSLMGDQPTGAVGSGGFSGGSGAVGGQTNTLGFLGSGGSSSFQAFGPRSVTSQSTNYFTSTTVGLTGSPISLVGAPVSR